jgi:cobalt-zinc-cadmium efflux system protein
MARVVQKVVVWIAAHWRNAAPNCVRSEGRTNRLPITRGDVLHTHDSHHVGRPGDLAVVSDARLLWAVALNQVLTVAQVVAGVVSGSVALLSDAAHNFNDANALLIAYVARRISRKRANRRYTFGYRRAEMIGAVINLTLLATIGLYLIYEAIMRLFQPVEIMGWLMAATSFLALIVDVGTAVLLWAMSRGSLNVRAAFVHNLVDALGSLAVLIGAVTIICLHWTWIDPVLTLAIAGYVLWQVVAMLPRATRVLMEGAPIDLEFDRLIEDVEAIEGVAGIHHVHVWELDEQHRAMEAHVSISRDRAGQLDTLKHRVKQLLIEKYEIRHSTLEFEFVDPSPQQCHDTAVLPEH